MHFLMCMHWKCVSFGNAPQSIVSPRRNYCRCKASTKCRHRCGCRKCNQLCTSLCACKGLCESTKKKRSTTTTFFLETVEGIPLCLETKQSKLQKIERPIFRETHKCAEKHQEIQKEENVMQKDDDNKSTAVPWTIFNNESKTVISHITEMFDKPK